MKKSEQPEQHRYQLGSTVRVRLYAAGGTVDGKMTAIIDTASGQKIVIRSGDRVITVKANQIVAVLKM